MPNKYYIAYGSNLSVEQMEKRTPDAVIVGTGILRGWRLLFRQFATIQENENFDTPVLVWKISAQDEKNLDRYEGFPRFYRKKNLRVHVKSLNGEDLGELTAMVYIMTSRAVNSRFANPLPSDYYYNILDKGYETFGFDKKILEGALIEVYENVSFIFGS